MVGEEEELVTPETLFHEWQRDVEAVAICGSHIESAWDYIQARLDQIGRPIYA